MNYVYDYKTSKLTTGNYHVFFDSGEYTGILIKTDADKQEIYVGQKLCKINQPKVQSLEQLEEILKQALIDC